MFPHNYHILFAPQNSILATSCETKCKLLLTKVTLQFKSFFKHSTNPELFVSRNCARNSKYVFRLVQNFNNKFHICEGRLFPLQSLHPSLSLSLRESFIFINPLKRKNSRSRKNKITVQDRILL